MAYACLILLILVQWLRWTNPVFLIGGCCRLLLSLNRTMTEALLTQALGLTAASLGYSRGRCISSADAVAIWESEVAFVKCYLTDWTLPSGSLSKNYLYL